MKNNKNISSITQYKNTENRLLMSVDRVKNSSVSTKNRSNIKLIKLLVLCCFAMKSILFDDMLKFLDHIESLIFTEYLCNELE